MADWLNIAGKTVIVQELPQASEKLLWMNY